MDYGRAIRIARALAGMQQSELAKSAKLTSSYISLLESGRRQPSAAALQKLSKALGMPQHLLMLLGADREEVNIRDPNALRSVAESLTRILFADDPREKRRTRKNS